MSRASTPGQPAPKAAPLQKGRTRAAKPAAHDREICPRCGRPTARIIGRSESLPILYLRCNDCQQTSVAPA